MKREICASLIVFTLVCNALVCADLYLYLDNSIYSNGNWVSSKTQLARRPLASVAFFVTNVALARNHMNLGVWQGFHEIIYKRSLDPSRIELDAFVSGSKNFSLITITDRDKEGFSGFALRNPSRKKSYFFHANSEGKYTSKALLGGGIPVKTDAWNHLRFDRRDDRIEVFINGTKGGQFPRRNRGPGQFGFRADSLGDNTLIDNITVRNNDGSILVENFDNRRHLLPWTVGILAALSILTGLLFHLTRKRNPLPRLLLLNAVLMVCLGGLYAYTFHHLSGLYPREESINWRGFTNRLEEADDMGPRLIKEYGTDKGRDSYRVMLIGSSQTWGEGASQDKFTLGAVIQRQLSRDFSRLNKTFQVINAGLRGADSARLIPVYERELLKLKPDLLLVNLSNMDLDAQILAKNLERFLELNRTRGIKTVFSVEPSLLYDKARESRHLVMRAIGKKHGIPVVDSQRHLESKRAEGFIWWDIAHLTDYGQRLLAQRLIQDGIRPMLKD